MPVTYASLTARDRDWGLDDFVAEVNRLLPEVVPGDAAARGKLEITPRLVRHYTTEGVLPRPLKEGVEARYDGDHLVRALALRRLLAEGYPSSLAGRFLERHDRERLARFLLGELRPDLDLAPGGPAVVDAAAPPNEAALERLAAMRARAGLPPLRQTGAAAGRSRDDAPGLRAPKRSAAASWSPATSLNADEDVGDDADRVEGSNLRERAAAPSASPPPPAERCVAWTRYPLLDGLELHVRDDFVDPTTPAAWNALRDTLLARLEAIALERTLRRR